MNHQTWWLWLLEPKSGSNPAPTSPIITGSEYNILETKGKRNTQTSSNTRLEYIRVKFPQRRSDEHEFSRNMKHHIVTGYTYNRFYAVLTSLYCASSLAIGIYQNLSDMHSDAYGEIIFLCKWFPAEPTSPSWSWSWKIRVNTPTKHRTEPTRSLS